jgi:hypothetical protein
MARDALSGNGEGVVTMFQMVAIEIIAPSLTCITM